MAKLKGPFDFLGKLGELSAYTMQGHDGIILRRSSGPSKEDIKNKPAFDITCRHNGEFGGRSNSFIPPMFVVVRNGSSVLNKPNMTTQTAISSGKDVRNLCILDPILFGN